MHIFGVIPTEIQKVAREQGMRAKIGEFEHPKGREVMLYGRGTKLVTRRGYPCVHAYANFIKEVLIRFPRATIESVMHTYEGLEDYKKNQPVVFAKTYRRYGKQCACGLGEEHTEEALATAG